MSVSFLFCDEFSVIFVWYQKKKIYHKKKRKRKQRIDEKGGI